MKTLVAYTTQTGNTRKVAEAIYSALEGDKELMPVKQVRALEGYDLAFLGFPVHGGAPDARTKAFMASQAAGRKIAIFLTHGAPTGHRLAQEAVANYRDCVPGATVLGTFECQGQVARMVKVMMRLSPDPDVKAGARQHDDEGQPDAAALQRAAAWAQEIVAAAA